MARIGIALAAALAAGAARAQWRSEPMPVRLEAPWLDVVAGAQAVAGQDDLLVLDQTARTARTRRHHALLAPQPSSFPMASLPLERAFRSGYLSQDGTDGFVDVASHYATGPLTPVSRIDVVFGDQPGVLRSFNLPKATDQYGPAHGGPPFVTSFLKLLAKTPRADTLVLPYCLEDICTNVFLVDFDPAPLPTATTRVLPSPDFALPMDVQPEAFPVWLSPAARANALDDVAIGVFGAVVLYAHRSLPASPTLAALDLTDPIVVGTTASVSNPAWLPRTIQRLSEVRGVASLDVDFDGVPDLVFTMATPDFPIPGALVWVKGTGVAQDFADPDVAPWGDLGAQLLLPDPMTVRPLRVGGRPAVAVWDRKLQEVLVVTSDAASRRLDVWRAPAPGGFARDILLADVVGSPGPDLLVVMDEGDAPGTVLVYADLGLPAPELSWDASSPGTLARGVPVTLGVALDPGGPSSVTVEWIQGVPTNAPVGTGPTHDFGVDCTMPPRPLAVVVRATDDTGQFDELFLTTTLAPLRPAIALAGSSPSGRLVLPRGGATAVLEGVTATGCGLPAWGGAWPAPATVTDESRPTGVRRTVLVPEAAYPALLADPAFAVSLATTDPAFAATVATLALSFDASALVEVTHESDRTTLADGDIAVVRTRLRSRVSAALPAVRVTHALEGLVPAGSPVVAGAAPIAASPDGTELVLDVLPAAGAEVTISLPVRGTGRPGGSSVEARSSGGWPLTPPVHTESAPARLPGCGCGGGAGPGWTPLALLAFALRRRRRA
jgi:MYXO-CTERM domain-containing protein